MILNLKEFENAKSSDEIYTFPFQFTEEIPESMPKFTVDPLELMMSNTALGETNSEGFDIFRNVDFEKRHLDSTREFMLKTFYNKLGMYGFVSWEWLNPFIEWLGNRKCLEVMAGRGWLSKGLREKGVNVIATDDYSWHGEKFLESTLTDIENLDAVKAVEKYGADVDIVIMSWPYMDNTAFQVLKRLNDVNPNAAILYIGEYGGCTADDDFIEAIQLCEEETEFWENVAPHFKSWELVRDSLFLVKYKGENVNEY